MKERNPYKLLTRVVLTLGALAVSAYTLSGHLAKVSDVTQGTTGNSAFSLLSGQLPPVRGGVATDPSEAAVEYAKGLVGDGGKKSKEAKLVMFPSNTSMTPEQRAKVLAEAERLRPDLPETPKRR